MLLTLMCWAPHGTCSATIRDYKHLRVRSGLHLKKPGLFLLSLSWLCGHHANMPWSKADDRYLEKVSANWQPNAVKVSRPSAAMGRLDPDNRTHLETHAEGCVSWRL